MAGLRVVTQRLQPAGGQPASPRPSAKAQRPGWMRLSPRGVGALLDQSFALYVASFGQLVGAAVLCFVPLFLLFDALVTPWLVEQGLEVIASSLRDPLPKLLLVALVSLFVASQLLGPRRGLGRLFLQSSLRLPALVVLSILRQLLVVVLCCMLLVPGALGLWCMAIVPMVYLLEGRALVQARREEGHIWLPFQGMFLALGRSFRLSWSMGSLGRFCGAGLTAMLLVSPMLGISALQDDPELRVDLMSLGYFDSELAKLGLLVMGAVGQAAAWVFFYIFLVLYYLDLRVRRDALDLELELEALIERSAR